MVEGSSEMNVIKRKTIDTEESFEKIGEEVEKKETQVSKKLDKVTQDNKIDEKQQVDADRSCGQFELFGRWTICQDL